VIAVQTLQTERRLHKQHESLVKAVSQLCHTNLLKFDGYCIDKHGSFLCYEYQRYQTLEECLLGMIPQKNLLTSNLISQVSFLYNSSISTKEKNIDPKLNLKVLVDLGLGACG